MAVPDGSGGILSSRAHRRALQAAARRQERQAARKSEAKPASARLILDPLEPRVLLNADTLAVQVAALPHQTQAHDVLVRMVNDTITVGAQTQTVQRVQVVDQTSGGAILAMGDLSEIRAVAIAVTSGSDTITLDLNSFGANTMPKFQVQGDGMTALAIAHATGTVGWQVNGDGSGSVTGAGAAVGFTGVSGVTGGGDDVLNGPSPNTTWQVTGPGSGSLATNAGGPATSFQGFSALAGAANNDDTFDVYPGGSMPGGIDGGAGGYDTLAYVGGKFSDVTSIATGPHSGSVTADGTTIVYAGMEPVTLAQSANVTLTLTGANGTATLTDVAGSANELILTDPGNIESQAFIAPGIGGSLTIDLGAGAGNTLTLTGIDGRLGSSLTVQNEVTGDFAGTGDTVNIDSNLVTPGGNISIAAPTINLGTSTAGNTIDTRNLAGAGGNAGNVSFSGRNITVNDGSEILATAPVGMTPGSVSLVADDSTLDAPILPIDWTIKSVGVALDDSEIQAGNVTITSTAEDLGLVSDLPPVAEGFTSMLVGVLNQIPGDIISGLTGMDASVIYRGAKAITTVSGSTIDSSGAVTILGTIDSTNTVTATATSLSSNADKSSTPVQFSLGVAATIGTVEAMVENNSVIDAAGDVTILANGTVTASASSQTSANLTGANKGATNGNVVQIAGAVTVDNLTATAEVDNSSKITAGGDVNLSANGSTSSVPVATTQSYQGGAAGVAIALGFDTANIHSYLNGTVTAQGSVSSWSTVTRSTSTTCPWPRWSTPS